MTDDAVVLTQALAKEERLKDAVSAYGSVAVAYSGGLDSTYLADVAHEALGHRAWIVLADSPSIPRAELRDAREIAESRGWNFQIMQTEEFDREDYLRNTRERCYYCKQELFGRMREFAEAHGIAVLAYGAIMDDLADLTRVGPKAAAEMNVKAPLQDVELTKGELRYLSARRKLPTSDKPSFACLASRVPSGTPLSVQTLAMIEKTEDALKALGFRQYRARHHGDVCRIEVAEEDIARILDAGTRQEILRQARAAGYRFVAVDLAGYRTGSTA